MPSFRPEDTLCRVPDMISTELDQETVLMNVDAGAYYGLAGPAQSIWRALEAPITFATLLERLTQLYDVAPDTCAAEVERFLLDLRKEGLLRVNPAQTA